MGQYDPYRKYKDLCPDTCILWLLYQSVVYRKLAIRLPHSYYKFLVIYPFALYDIRFLFCLAQRHGLKSLYTGEK